MNASDDAVFQAKFVTREQAKKYRDRYITGRRARIDLMEKNALRRLLANVGKLETALDIPSGAGRLSPVLNEVAGRMVLADASAQMLQLAREDLPNLPAVYLETDVLKIDLPDKAVDLSFCHRFLHHIHDRQLRAKVFQELTRVSRRYVVLSYYTPGFRDRWHWLRHKLGLGAGHNDYPASLRQFNQEAETAGLRLSGREILRKFPLQAMFCLFERTDAAR